MNVNAFRHSLGPAQAIAHIRLHVNTHGQLSCKVISATLHAGDVKWLQQLSLHKQIANTFPGKKRADSIILGYKRNMDNTKLIVMVTFVLSIYCTLLDYNLMSDVEPHTAQGQSLTQPKWPTEHAKAEKDKQGENKTKMAAVVTQ